MIYFDNSATTPMLPEVIQAMKQVQEQFIGNPSSLHKLGAAAFQLLQKAKEQLASLLHCQKNELFLTSGGTESNNTAIIGTAFEKKQYGNHIITTAIEHPSVLKTMAFLEKQGFEVTYLPVSSEGRVCANDLKNALRPNTILVSVMWVNNEVGTIQPIEELGEILTDFPTVHFHVDAVQATEQVLLAGIPKRVDLMSFSGHKLHASRGVGLLYKKDGRRIAPLLHGGGQEQQLRSGTENVAGIVGLAKAMRLYQETKGEMFELKQQLYQFLNSFPHITIFTPKEKSASHILTFCIKGIRGEVLVHALEEENIYISTTSACSSKADKGHHTLAAMQVAPELSKCAVRVSLSKQSTQEELEQFKQLFSKVYQKFEKISG